MAKLYLLKKNNYIVQQQVEQIISRENSFILEISPIASEIWDTVSFYLQEKYVQFEMQSLLYLYRDLQDSLYGSG